MRNIQSYEGYVFEQSLALLEGDKSVADKIKQAEGMIDAMKGKRGPEFTARRRRIEAALEKLRAQKEPAKDDESPKPKPKLAGDLADMLDDWGWGHGDARDADLDEIRAGLKKRSSSGNNTTWSDAQLQKALDDWMEKQ